MADSFVSMSRPLPDKPRVDGLEAAWIETWESEGVYRFSHETTREQVFSIDTPPPTVSGSLHIGHVFSYTHADLIARFWRMRGRNVFYPMGWDDNGLATERRVENYFGVRCDPALAYDAAFTPPDEPPAQKISVSRRNFVELCHRLTAIDEVAFKDLWRHLGISVDWSLEYATVSDRSRAISQRAFLLMRERDEVFSQVAPTLWDVDFRTAVSQAELEDRDRPSAYHRLAFTPLDGGPVVEIDTTRPELLPSCVALVCHPDDERYRALVGSEVLTPLFRVPVPVLTHELADPTKGTGIAMVCTFGDQTDVTWWRELSLPTRALIGRDGRFMAADFSSPEFPSRDAEGAQGLYGEIEGRSVNQARTAIVEALVASGALLGEPRPITHAVKFYEKGERPLEIVTSRQWFVRTLSMREKLLARGEEITWHPDFMKHRYSSWVEGLNVDWNISRQRFFGVPFPVWYPLDERGEPDYDQPLVAEESRLPVDPSSDVPTGYLESQRGEPGGFVGDPDVMDTWATSSLTPQIAGDWGSDLFTKVFPMDLRPQAHEIIRTWLFSTVVRADLEFDSVPFTHALISGWVLDPDRKKMSKSKGNVVTPMPLIETHGADALRYWAASGRPGTDTAIDEGQMKIGRRLATKVLNVTKFVLGRLSETTLDPAKVTTPLDLDLLSQLATLVREATADFERYDYARALERTESFFWRFCDDYVELVKTRAYGEGSDSEVSSARTTLALTLSALTRLLAPTLPFATEEAWRWWHDSSVHRAPWPTQVELATPSERSTNTLVYGSLAKVLEAVRRTKSEGKVNQRHRVARCVVEGSTELLSALREGEADLRAAGSIDELTYVESPVETITVELASS